MRIWKYLAVVIVFSALLAASSVFPNIGLMYISTTDPTTAGGVSAPMYQLLWRTDVPSVYYKSGTAATAWTQVGIGSSSITPTTVGADNLFGTGADGDLVFDGVNPVKGVAPVGSVYTMTTDLYADDMSISSGVTVVTSSRLIFVQGTLSGTGKITRNGSAGAVGTSVTAAGGAAVAASFTPGAYAGSSVSGGACAPNPNTAAYYWCVASSASNGGGTSNVTANHATAGTACRGGGGGGSSAGIPNTEGGDVTVSGGAYEIYLSPFTIGWMGRRAFTPETPFDNQSGGGCSRSAGGGSGGGWIFLMVRNCGTGSNTVEAKGGAGASISAAWTSCNAGNACDCSGSGGGPGGTIFLYCGAGTLPTTDNAPGAGGTGQTASGSSCANAAGTPGTGPGNCCSGNGGRGGTGRKSLFSPSTGWTHTTDA